MSAKDSADGRTMTYTYLSLFDFGARYYDAYVGRWNAIDPLAHKYFGMSPYNYCGNDPVNFFDPDGLSIYTIDEDGTVKLYQKTDDDYDEVYAAWGERPLDVNAAHVRVNDKTILSSMAEGNNPSGNSSRQDMKHLFKFAADTFDNQEWGLYYNGDSYELTTQSKSEGVSTSLDGVTWKVHSHPNTKATTFAEYESIGFCAPYSAYNEQGDFIGCEWGKVKYGMSTTGHPCDWQAYNNDYNRSNGRPAKSLVYFPVSGRCYNINYNSKPNLVKL